MKILNIKQILFSLMATLAVSVFMISCEQELETEQKPDVSLASPMEAQEFIIAQPEGLSEEEAKTWLTSLSVEEMIELDVSEELDKTNTDAIESRGCGSWYTSCRNSYGCYCPGYAPNSSAWIEFCKQKQYCYISYYNSTTKKWYSYYHVETTSEWQNGSRCYNKLC